MLLSGVFLCLQYQVPLVKVLHDGNVVVWCVSLPTVPLIEVLHDGNIVVWCVSVPT